MKKLRLNKLFHWLYAFLMFYPILCYFGTIVMWAFNQSFTFDSPGPNNFSDFFNQSVASYTLIADDFSEGSLGYNFMLPIQNLVSYFGFSLSDNTDLTCVFGSLFTHWIAISLFYLLFDVLMYPINLFHRWIDEGGI